MNSNSKTVHLRILFHFYLVMDDFENAYIISCTQGDEDMDVTWDWSAVSKTKPSLQKPSRKRICPSQSPKLTIKRHPSNSQIPKFDRLKQDIEALRSGLSCGPSSNDCVINNNTVSQSPSFEDDSFDEQLLFCTQQVEKELDRSACKSETKIDLEYMLTPPSASNTELQKSSFNGDDSFDLFLGQIQVDELQNSVKVSEVRSVPNDKLFPSINDRLNAGTSLQRHKSCDLPVTNDCQKGMFQKHNSFDDGNGDTSRVKSSSEIIERNRQRALAILEAKKKQTIERNRLEALKRLEASRRRKMLQNQFSNLK